MQAVENNLTLMELKASQEKLLEDLREKFKFDEIIGNSPQMVEILKTVADVADTDSTVLIEGESGTGAHRPFPQEGQRFPEEAEAPGREAEAALGEAIRDPFGADRRDGRRNPREDW